jgi:hypothetical protein
VYVIQSHELSHNPIIGPDPSHSPLATWDRLASVEKVLQLAAADHHSGLLTQLTDLLRSRHNDGDDDDDADDDSYHPVVSIRAVITLAVFAYALVGNNSPTDTGDNTSGFPVREEREFRQALVLALSKRLPRHDAVVMAWLRLNALAAESSPSLSELGLRVDELLARIRRLRHSRLALEHEAMRNLFSAQRSPLLMSSSPFVPFLERLTSRILVCLSPQ